MKAFQAFTAAAGMALLLIMAAMARAATIELTSLGNVGVGHVSTSTVPGSRLHGEILADQRAQLLGTVLGGLPPGAHLYPLVRRDGEDLWEVQGEAINLRGTYADWKAEVRLGTAVDKGKRYMLQVSAAYGRLPLGRISADVLARNVVTSSSVLSVVRRVTNPYVWISGVNGRAVHQDSNEVLDVSYQTPIEVKANDLPQGACIGVAIQPVKPWTDRKWVMLDCVPDESGVVTGHFGMPGLTKHAQFRLWSFIAWELPTPGVAIPPEEWKRNEDDFLAESRPVTALLWDSDIRIDEIDGIQAVHNSIIAADEQAEVSGSISRSLQSAEKVWLICIPRTFDPWIAGWTRTWRDGGKWVLHAAQLGKPGLPALFDLVAVVSSEDPRSIEASKLREWVYEARERSINSPRVNVAHHRVRN